MALEPATYWVSRRRASSALPATVLLASNSALVIHTAVPAVLTRQLALAPDRIAPGCVR